MEYQYLMLAARSFGNVLVSFFVIYLILRKVVNLRLRHSRKIVWFLFAWFLSFLPYFFTYESVGNNRPIAVLLAPFFISILVLFFAKKVDTCNNASLYKLLLPIPIFFVFVLSIPHLERDGQGTTPVTVGNKGGNSEWHRLPQPLQRDSLPSGEYLFSFRKNNKSGFHNSQGQIVIEPHFDLVGGPAAMSIGQYVENFDHGMCAVFVSGKWGFINRKGEMIIKPKFDGVKWFKNGLAAINRGANGPFGRDGKWGFINKVGEEVIECQFDNAWEFNEEGVAAVEFSGRWGLINRVGEIVVNPRYQWPFAIFFSDGLTQILTMDDKYGFMDKSGKVVIDPRFDDVTRFDNGLAAVYNGERDDYGIVPGQGKWTFIDKTGRLAFRLEVDDTNGFSENLAGVEIDGKWGVINNSGQFIVKPVFDKLDDFHEGLAPVNIGGKKSEYYVPEKNAFAIQLPWRLGGIFEGGQWGFIDRTGTMAIEPQFDEVKGFSDGLAAVRIGDRWGFIDRNGHFAIKPLIDIGDASSSVLPTFGEAGWIWVKYNGKVGWINRFGESMKVPNYRF